jgi:hypothetical protein
MRKTKPATKHRRPSDKPERAAIIAVPLFSCFPQEAEVVTRFGSEHSLDVEPSITSARCAPRADASVGATPVRPRSRADQVCSPTLKVQFYRRCAICADRPLPAAQQARGQRDSDPPHNIERLSERLLSNIRRGPAFPPSEITITGKQKRADN